ncbi:MAG: hypothetical protein ACOYXT_20400 [Bacteroidota bacterium]
MQQKAFIGKIGKIINRSIAKKRVCGYPGCTKTTISSHLLQKNKILNQITESNHLYELYPSPLTGQMKFKLTGKNDAFTFYGYCKEHDDSIFSPIEKSDYDISEYNVQLLFSLRSLLNELRKKEILIEGYENVLKDSSISKFLDSKSLRLYISQSKLSYNDLYFYLSEAHKDISERTESFAFDVFIARKLPLCVSAIFHVASSFDILINFIKPFKKENEVLPAVILNLFPRESETVILVGYHKKYSKGIPRFIDSHIKKIPHDESLKSLSDLIISKIETWTCSPTFYRNNISEREELIIKSISTLDGSSEVPFNIFTSD